VLLFGFYTGFRLPFVRIFGKMHAASPGVTLPEPNTDFAAGSPVAEIFFTLVKEKSYVNYQC